jgi:stage III sporulation protein AG
MWDKLKNDKYVKDLLIKLVTILFVAAIALLLFDVLTQSKDGRRQIVDMDGGSEYTEETSLATEEEIRLEGILSQMKGVGDTSVMITYQYIEKPDTVFSSENNKNDRKVEGVIIAAEGAGDIIIRSNIIDAVATVFDIPASNVVVFEKSGGDME